MYFIIYLINKDETSLLPLNIYIYIYNGNIKFIILTNNIIYIILNITISI